MSSILFRSQCVNVLREVLCDLCVLLFILQYQRKYLEYLTYHDQVRQ